MLILIPVTAAHITLGPASESLYVEGGVIETLSVVFWVGGVLLCIWALFRQQTRVDRLMFKWFCVICTLAAARELDAQVLLNPENFGRYGVHYRIDWFFSNKFGVSIYLKLIWGTIFMAALASLSAPLVVRLKPIMRSMLNGDTAAGLFLLGIIAMAIGFTNDDILREVDFMRLDLRIAIEETSEMIGSIFFFTGICCLLWKSASQNTEVCAE